jgi:hypothetical protein
MSKFQKWKRRYGPHFETRNVTNINVQVGRTFYLHCRISLLLDKTVRNLNVILFTKKSNLRILSYLIPAPTVWLFSAVARDILSGSRSFSWSLEWFISEIWPKKAKNGKNCDGQGLFGIWASFLGICLIFS